MSQTVAPQPRLPTGGKSQLAIVASQFNQEYTDGLVDAAISELSNLLPHSRVDLIRVPGAFEIPLATKLILANEKPSAVICLGVIIEGETAHADLVATSVTDQLLALSLEFSTPVVHEVLLVSNESQAEARCLGEELNRGTDAAQAAAGMIEVCKELSKNVRSR
jgi:6,7-dimethyl-8-ribityllumazine synthase